MGGAQVSGRGQGGYISNFGRDEGFTSVYLSPNTSSYETATRLLRMSGSSGIIYRERPGSQWLRHGLFTAMDSRFDLV